MIKDLAETLTAAGAQPVDVLQSWRAWLARVHPDLSPEDMRAEMAAAADPGRVQQLLDRFAAHPELLETAALLLLSDAWEREADRAGLTDAITQARVKMPVVEVGIVSATCLYGLYLLLTKGVKRKEHKVVTRKDGSFELTEITEYVELGNVFGAVTRLFPGEIDPPG